MGEDFEGRLGEQLGFPEAGGVIDEIQCADLVVGTPASPVTNSARHLGKTSGNGHARTVVRAARTGSGRTFTGLGCLREQGGRY